MAFININSDFIFSSSDFTADSTYNSIELSDANGKSLFVNQWEYAFYLYTQCLEHTPSNNRKEVYIREYPLHAFMKKTKSTTTGWANELAEFMSKLSALGYQKEMRNKLNAHINCIALYFLGAYVRHIIHNKRVILFKPTIADTLKMVEKAENVTNITFTTKKGDKIESDSANLIKSMFTMLSSQVENNNNNTYEFHKIEKAIKVYRKEYGQILFIRYLSKFFHDYYNVDRRKNSYISLTEQHIICFMMKFFGFSVEMVSESRYRQLFNSKFEETYNMTSLPIPHATKTIYIELPLLTYSVWKEKPLDPMLQSLHFKKEFKPQISIAMGDNSDCIMPLSEYLSDILNNW